jgi:hypothetical protein
LRWLCMTSEVTRFSERKKQATASCRKWMTKMEREQPSAAISRLSSLCHSKCLKIPLKYRRWWSGSIQTDQSKIAVLWFCRNA